VVQAHFFILSFCKALVFLWLEERICWLRGKSGLYLISLSRCQSGML
jgi:bacteriorhodopsin